MPDLELPTIRGIRKYLSRSKHQLHSVSQYSKWVSTPIELETFNNADIGSDSKSWESNEHLFGFYRDRGEIVTVGTKKEQFGFFPKTQNITDHWHGYPVIPFSEQNKKYHISEHLLQRWENEEILTADEIAILVNGKLL